MLLFFFFFSPLFAGGISHSSVIWCSVTDHISPLEIFLGNLWAFPLSILFLSKLHLVELSRSWTWCFFLPVFWDEAIYIYIFFLGLWSFEKRNPVFQRDRPISSLEVCRNQNGLQKVIARDHPEHSLKWFLFGINQQIRWKSEIIGDAKCL